MTTNVNPPSRVHPLCALCGLSYPDSIHLRESTPGYHPFRETHVGPKQVRPRIGPNDSVKVDVVFEIPDQDQGLRHWARLHRNSQGALYIEVMETNSQGRDILLFTLGLDVEQTIVFKRWASDLVPDRKNLVDSTQNP